jgi:hypothetical protein
VTDTVCVARVKMREVKESQHSTQCTNTYLVTPACNCAFTSPLIGQPAHSLLDIICSLLMNPSSLCIQHSQVSPQAQPKPAVTTASSCEPLCRMTPRSCMHLALREPMLVKVLSDCVKVQNSQRSQKDCCSSASECSFRIWTFTVCICCLPAPLAVYVASCIVAHHQTAIYLFPTSAQAPTLYLPDFSSVLRLP